MTETDRSFTGVCLMQYCCVFSYTAVCVPSAVITAMSSDEAINTIKSFCQIVCNTTDVFEDLIKEVRVYETRLDKTYNVYRFTIHPQYREHLNIDPNNNKLFCAGPNEEYCDHLRIALIIFLAKRAHRDIHLPDGWYEEACQCLKLIRSMKKKAPKALKEAYKIILNDTNAPMELPPIMAPLYDPENNSTADTTDVTILTSGSSDDTESFADLSYDKLYDGDGVEEWLGLNKRRRL